MHAGMAASVRWQQCMQRFPQQVRRVHHERHGGKLLLRAPGVVQGLGRADARGRIQREQALQQVKAGGGQRAPRVVVGAGRRERLAQAPRRVVLPLQLRRRRNKCFNIT